MIYKAPSLSTLSSALDAEDEQYLHMEIIIESTGEEVWYSKEALNKWAFKFL